ncbi:hypothetical protein H5410_046027 [Solanum commersonii]|uniref:Uncharacterized protein n=1 Tax=Solanum commersonii TaxID=4109 RepID=A0A9J5XB59_SOLCO|nr:hypothetical protein H5410_046027 [Solanum commersonii]
MTSPTLSLGKLFLAHSETLVVLAEPFGDMLSGHLPHRVLQDLQKVVAEGLAELLDESPNRLGKLNQAR